MDTTIKTFDVQSVELATSFDQAFAYISNPAHLPQWTAAFKQADEQSAVLVTPWGELRIGLTTIANKSCGTVDWHMTMPDGTVGKAYSRLTTLNNNKVLYSFVLLAPPVPVEQIEGTLEEQKKLLAGELKNLERILR